MFLKIYTREKKNSNSFQSKKIALQIFFFVFVQIDVFNTLLLNNLKSKIKI